MVMVAVQISASCLINQRKLSNKNVKVGALSCKLIGFLKGMKNAAFIAVNRNV